MPKSIAGLFNEFFKNKMESFETCFPGVITAVNDGGTVDVCPSIKNCLKNMQYEPTDKDGKLNQILEVPVLYPGTNVVDIHYELKAGDPVLLVSASRDLTNWAEGDWDENAYDPLSFGGCDVLSLIAIPMRRKKATKTAKTTINIDANGAVTIESSGAVTVQSAKKVKLQADFVGVKKDLVVGGQIQAGGDIATMMNSVPISLGTHVHESTAPGTPTLTPQSPVPPIPVPEPS